MTITPLKPLKRGSTFRLAGGALCHVVAVVEDDRGELIITYWLWSVSAARRKYRADEAWVVDLWREIRNKPKEPTT